uniref:beta-glucosidase n=1 Tax=Alexandrium catenella TaxID=2925 RepID=A0A7S1RU70_ALECA|mmetsp:Transcript_71053/g.188917  ORF Transcript_71053/g.188917 Transcript_71053/m.188917 type:complete len:141 (+) Transcript_71053:2-424(+)
MAPSFQAAFPFGHGLSYASFIYQDIRQKPRCNYPLCVVLTVLNSHPTNSGAEVVQVYFRFHNVTNYPPVLRGFYKTKVLRPGETDKALFAFNHRDISTYNDVAGETHKEASWTPQDEIEVMFGSSSSDIRGRLNVITKHG